MNKRLLRAEMLLHGDTNKSLADYLGIAESTLSNKINESRGAEFSQNEMNGIRKRYSLSNEKFINLFFNPSVS